VTCQPVVKNSEKKSRVRWDDAHGEVRGRTYSLLVRNSAVRAFLLLSLTVLGKEFFGFGPLVSGFLLLSEVSIVEFFFELSSGSVSGSASERERISTRLTFRSEMSTLV
jgi:hypothetical protein